VPDFFHARSDAGSLIDALASERGLRPALVEKDYWVMHCLWGLQQNGLRFELKGGTSLSKGWGIIDRFSEDIDLRFEAPASLDVKGDREVHVRARLAFFDELASRIRIPGVVTERNRAFDDEIARNGGISLRYESSFDRLSGLRPEVLLEAGFARTAPNEPRLFSSWVLDKALATRLEVADNRAPDVKCFTPEYTFVDKLQTICRYFRQHRENPEDVRPRMFLRHYYDLSRLLGVDRVLRFLRTDAYVDYKGEKLGGRDLLEFTARTAFTLPDARTFSLFEEEFGYLEDLMIGPSPSFSEVARRIREHADQF